MQLYYYNMTTTIKVEDDTWLILNKRKQVGESFDSVIKKALLEIPEIKKKIKANKNK